MRPRREERRTDKKKALCGSGLGILIASVFPDIAVALQVAPVIILPLMIFSGLFIQVRTCGRCAATPGPGGAED